MADFDIPYDQIEAARKEGYSDRQIADHVGKMLGIADQITAARKEGYSDTDIVSYLSPPPKREEKPAEPEKPKEEAGWGSDLKTGFYGTSQKMAATAAVRAEGEIEELKKKIELYKQGDDPEVPERFRNAYRGRKEQVPGLERQLAEAERRRDSTTAEVAKDAAALKALPVNEPLQRFTEGNIGELLENPGAVARGLIGQSATGLVPLMAGTIAGGPAGGAIAGGLLGLTTGGGEEATRILQKNGVDLTNVEAVRKALADPAIKAEIEKGFGTAQAIEGVVGGATGALGGVNFTAKTMAGTIAKNVGLQAAGQGSLSAGGEAAKQAFVEGGEMNLGKIAAAGIGEALFAPADAVGGAIHARQVKANQAAESPRLPTTEEVGRSVMDASSTEEAITALREAAAPEQIDEYIEGARAFGNKAENERADMLQLYRGLGEGEVQTDEAGNFYFQDGDGEVSRLKPWDGTDRPGYVSRATADAIRDVYVSRMGLDVVFIDDANTSFDGVFQNGKIFLSTKPDRLAAQVAAHEVGHVLLETPLPDGQNLSDRVYEIISEKLTQAGRDRAEELFGHSAPKREAYADGPEGDARHAAAVERHLVAEMGAEMLSELPKLEKFIPDVINEVQARYGADAAKGVLQKFLSNLRESMTRLREFFFKPAEGAEYGQPPTQIQNYLTNMDELYSIGVKLYAERFGTQAEKENAALLGMRQKAVRERMLAEAEAPAREVPPPTAPQGFTDGQPVPAVAPEVTAVAEPPAAVAAPERPSGPPLPPTYAEAAQKAAVYRRWLSELDEQRRADAPTSPEAKALQAQIDSILGKVRGNKDRLTNVARDRLEAARTALEEVLDPIGDSPTMARVRRALEAEQQRMADAAAVGTPSPGMERAVRPGPSRRALRPRGGPVDVRGQAVMPAERPVLQPANPTPAPVEAPTERLTVTPEAPVEAPPPAAPPTASRHDAEVRAEVEAIWSDPSLVGRLQRGLTRNEQWVSEMAAERIMRRAAQEELDWYLKNGLPEDEVGNVAKFYKPQDGETPAQAFERAADRWATMEEAKAIRAWEDYDVATFDWLRAGTKIDPVLDDAFTMLENMYRGRPLEYREANDIIPFPEGPTPTPTSARPGEAAARGAPGRSGGAEGSAQPEGGGRPVGEAGTAEVPARGQAEGDGVGPQFSPRQQLSSGERTAKLAEYKALMTEAMALGKVRGGNLTLAEGQRYAAKMREAMSVKFDTERPTTVERIRPAEETLSTLEPATVVAAHNDMIQRRSIYTALMDAVAGAQFNKDTAVDDIVNGKNPQVSPREFYEAFEPTREALRAQYGDTIPLYRAEGQQKPKATTNWATTEAFARQFGQRVVQRDVPVENVLAVNVTPNGKYHELIVGDRQKTLFSPRQRKIDMSTEEHDLTVNDILAPEYPKLEPRSRVVSDIARDLMARGSQALRALGVDPGRIENQNWRSDYILSKAIASEVEAAIGRRSNARKWYTEDVREALAVASAIHPEIAKQPHQRFGFIAALAITSQGETVSSNVRLAEQAYAQFKKTGRFPTDVQAKNKAAMNRNFEKLNSLLDEMGPTRTRNFLNREFTVRELERLGWKVGGENKDARVYGSSILGPKIGQGFFQNLNGNYTPVTMDLWFMRAWGRLTGTLVGKVDVSKQRARFEEELKAAKQPVAKTLPVLTQTAERILSKHESDFRKYRAEYDSGEREKSQLVLSAERLLAGLAGINETPSSGAHRQWMRDVINQARERLAREGMRVSNADLQALWWYPEKDLYAKLGGRESEAINVSYPQVLRELAAKRGIPDADVERAVRSVEYGPGRGGRADDAGADQDGGATNGRANEGRRSRQGLAAAEPEAEAAGVRRLDVTRDAMFSPRQREERDLIIQHNLSSENLLHANKMGGIPVPSLAVTRSGNAMTNFGDITLLGPREMADPRGYAKPKVYGSDIYSPRYPRVTFKFDRAQERQLLDAFAEGQKATDQRMDISNVQDEGVRDLERSAPVMWTFLRDQGIEPNVVIDPARRHMTNYALEKQIREAGLEDKLREFAAETMNRVSPAERIFMGFTDMGNRRYIPHTLDNVVKILKKDLRGGETGGNIYGIGQLRSKFTPQFRTIESVRREKGRLVSREEMEALKKEIDADFFSIVDDLRPAYTYGGDNLRFPDTVMGVMEEGATKGLKRTLKEYGFDVDAVSDDTLAKVGNFLNHLRNMPTEYFEAKIPRSVDLAEFSVAVIPDNASQKVRDALAGRGVEAVEYKAGDPADRQRVIAEAATAKADRILFSPRQNLRERGFDVDTPLYHQTRKDAVPSILEKGFDLTKGRARLNDEGVPDGVFLKPTPQDIGLGARGETAAQIPVYLRRGNVLRVADRDALAAHLNRDPEYRDLARSAVANDGLRKREFDQLWNSLPGRRTGASEAEYAAADRRMDAFLKEWDAENVTNAAAARARATEILKREGYDTVEMEVDEGSGGRKTKTFIALTGNQIAHASDDPKVLFSPRQNREPAPVFYSAVERALQGAKLEKAAPGQWLGTLKNMPGVKPEEIQWLGLEDWLKSQPKSVTKAEVLDYVRANQIEVKEVMKGAEPTERKAPSWTEVEGDAPTDTKFGQYALPGGENYRELLLTLPAKPQKPDVRVEQNKNTGGFDVIVRTSGGESRYDQVATRAEAEAAAAEAAKKNWTSPAEYRSSHWDEPNVLAHIRFDDRMVGNQKVLHVAEIQSDWHQAGRKKGYDDGRYERFSDQSKEVLQGDLSLSPNDLRWLLMNPASGENPARLAALRERFGADWVREANASLSSGKVPDAPFKTTWPELAMKRVIRYAAENGYDRVSWDTGETNADRFDLSKRVSEIHYSPSENRLYGVQIDGEKFETSVTPEKLPDTIGKEAAEKLLQQPLTTSKWWGSPRQSLSGLDLKVGGEGMAAFYDKQLPIIANKLGKKFGAKVEAVEVPAGNSYKGDAAFGFVEAINNATGGLYASANEALLRPFGQSGYKYEQAHSLEITDAMRNAVVEEGQPLFSPRQRDRSQTDTPEFKRFFGKSKAVDDEGQPLRLFHATDADEFNEFDTMDFGSWFAENPSTADTYMHKGHGGRPRVYEVYVRAERPLRIPEAFDLSDDHQVADVLAAINKANGTKITPKKIGYDADYEGVTAEFIGLNDKFIEEVKKAGFDSLHAFEQGDSTWAVLDAEQIKSATDNVGTFDPSNPDIRFSPRQNEPGSRFPSIEDADEATQKSVTRAVYDQAMWHASKRKGIKLNEALYFEAPEKYRSTLYDRWLENGALPEVQGQRFKETNPGGFDDFLRAFFADNDVFGEERKKFPEAVRAENKRKDDSDIRYSPRLRRPIGTENMNDEQAAVVTRMRGVDRRSPQEVLDEIRQDFGTKALREVFDPYAGIKQRDPYGYVGLRLANSTTGANDMFNTWGPLKKEGRAYAMAGEQTGGPAKLIKDLGDDAYRFMDWVAGYRAERLMAEGRENLIKAEDIPVLKTLNEGTLDEDYTLSNGKTTRSREAAYVDALKRLDAINKNALDNAVANGLLMSREKIQSEIRRITADRKMTDEQKQEAIKGLQARDALWSNPYYVPFFRQADEAGTRSFVGASTAPGMTGQTAGKRLKGGSQRLNTNLWENAFGNWAHMNDAGLRNSAANEVLMQAETDGLVARVSEADYDNKMSKAEKADVVWTMIEGKKQYWRVDDEFTLKAISALDYVRSDSPFMGIGRAAKKVLQVGIAADPKFQLRNGIRDTENAVAVSPISLNVFKNLYDGAKQQDVLNGVKNLFKAAAPAIFGEAQQARINLETANAIAGGATMRYAMGADQSFRGADTYLDSESKIGKFWDYFKNVGQKYTESMAFSENMNRLALYKQLGEGENPLPHDLRAFQGRDLSDFTLVGASPLIRHMVETVPYMNPWLQGLYKVGRAAADADKSVMAAVGGRVAMRLTTRLAGVMVSVIGLKLLNDAYYADDEDFKNRDEYDRNSNFWFKFGGKEWLIPMGFEVAALSSLSANWIETLYAADMTAARAWKASLQILGTQMAFNPIPQAVKPLLDVRANETRLGAPIESKAMERLRPEFRAGPQTTLVNRGVSEAMNKAVRAVAGKNAEAFSPVQLDYLVQAYTGWLGATALQIADSAVRGMSNEPVKPAKDSLPFWTLGLATNDRTSERPSGYYVNLLYKQGDAIQEAYATYQDLVKRGRAEEAKAYVAANLDDLKKYQPYSQVIRLEGEINQQIKAITENRELTAEQKRVQIMRLNGIKTRAAESVFKAVKQ